MLTVIATIAASTGGGSRREIPYVRPTFHWRPLAGAVNRAAADGHLAPHRGADRRDSGGRPRGRRQGRRAAREAFDNGPWPRLTPRPSGWRRSRSSPRSTPATLDEMADLITAEMGSTRSFSRLGQAAGALAQMHLESWRPPVSSLGPNGVTGLFGEVHCAGAGRRRRRDRAVERAAVLDHAEDDSGSIAGCTVVVKPAPETPLDAMWLAEMLEEVDLPEGVVSIVPGGRETGENLVRHPGMDKISFTGSSATGRRIAALCGEQLKRVSLELGGKSAAIILDDADIDHTVKSLKMASLMNNGQACVAQTRILVSERRHDEVVDALAEMVYGLAGRRSRRRSHRHRSACRATPAASRAGLHTGRGRRRSADRRRRRRQTLRPRLVCPADVVHRRDQPDADRPRGDLRPGADRAQILRRA